MLGTGQREKQFAVSSRREYLGTFSNIQRNIQRLFTPLQQLTNDMEIDFHTCFQGWLATVLKKQERLATLILDFSFTGNAGAV